VTNSTGVAAQSRKGRLAVLLSGGGRTLQNLIDCIGRGEIDAEIAVVISSLPQVKGVERARAAGLPVVVIRKKDHPDVDEFSRLIAETLDEYRPDLVCQAAGRATGGSRTAGWARS